MKVIEVWRVSVWDGGDRQNFSHYIDGKVPKEEVKASVSQYDDVSAAVLVVYDDPKEQLADSLLEIKRRAWHKLDPQERDALGMREEPK
jgi:hypothetical protein